MRAITLVLMLALPAVATRQSAPLADFADWEILDPGGSRMRYLGRPSLFLQDGIALMPDVQLADGVIEFDVAIHGQAGFAGIVFRGVSADDYELIYLRTHRSRAWDALQYTPVIAGQEAWQLYTGPGYNGVAELPANRWLHVRVEVEGYEARVFVDHATTPQLVVTDLKRPWASGRVGLWGRFGSAHFSNVNVSRADRSAPTAPAAAEPGAGGGGRWTISESFATSTLPTDRLPEGLSWEAVRSEPTGLLNIAAHRGPAPRTTVPTSDDRRSTVFARAILRAPGAERVRLSFGYSDDVTIFLDGRPLFSGRAGYQVRDPSYLGTLTLGPDALVLDLGAGRHELVFAVSETFGGWGVAAKLDDAGGIRFE